MKLTFVCSFLALVPAFAQADVIPIRLGENINLMPGQAALLQSGGYTSVVSCNGATTPSPDFTMHETINLPEDFQRRDESNARSLCEMGLYFSHEVAKKLTTMATNDCLRAYNRCEPLGNPIYSYVSRHKNRGKHGCYIEVTVRGRN
jgi:hypothetical protein